MKTPVVVADVNGNGVVNILDLVIVAGELGVENPSHADVNGDDTVNILYPVAIANAFGKDTPSINLSRP